MPDDFAVGEETDIIFSRPRQPGMKVCAPSSPPVPPVSARR